MTNGENFKDFPVASENYYLGEPGMLNPCKEYIILNCHVGSVEVGVCQMRSLSLTRFKTFSVDFVWSGKTRVICNFKV